MHIQGYDDTLRHVREPLAELTPVLLEAYRDQLFKTSHQRWDMAIPLAAVGAAGTGAAVTLALDSVTSHALELGLGVCGAVMVVGAVATAGLIRALPRWDSWVRLRAHWDKQRGRSPVVWIQVVEAKHRRTVDVEVDWDGARPALTWRVGPDSLMPVERRVLTSREALRDASQALLHRAPLRAEGRIRLDSASMPLFDLSRSPYLPDQLALRCRTSPHPGAETITFMCPQPRWMRDHHLQRLPTIARSGVYLSREDGGRLIRTLAEIGDALGRPIPGLRRDMLIDTLR